MVYVFLANGFEEVEALAPVDVLRRAGIETVTVGIGGRVINGAHEIMVTADIDDKQLHTNGLEAIVLPGGAVGTKNLGASSAVLDMIDCCLAQGKIVAAICAAPSILGKRGNLKGIVATAYPDFQKFLDGAILSEEPVCRDGTILTARGMGVSLEFGLKLVEVLRGPKPAKEIREQIQCRA